MVRKWAGFGSENLGVTHASAKRWLHGTTGTAWVGAQQCRRCDLPCRAGLIARRQKWAQLFGLGGYGSQLRCMQADGCESAA